VDRCGQPPTLAYYRAPKPFRFGDGPGGVTGNVLLSIKLPTRSRLGFWHTDRWRAPLSLAAIGPAKTVPEVPIRDSIQSVLIRGELSSRKSAFLGRSKRLKFWNSGSRFLAHSGLGRQGRFSVLNRSTPRSFVYEMGISPSDPATGTSSNEDAVTGS